jgi:DNA-binding transcriptional ArsR family regulator
VEKAIARPRHILISTPAQWRAVASPARFEMIEFMRALAPCSLAELAEGMDRPADSLYHHIRRLEKAGIARVVDRRKAGRQTEAVYDLTGDDLKLDFDASTGKNAKAITQLVAAVSRLAQRTFTAAVASDAMLGDPVKRFAIRSDSAWLDDDQLARVRDLLAQIVEIFETNKSSRHGKLYYLHAILSPIVRRRHARKRNKDSNGEDR